jgi:hypothetical protein
LKFGTGVTGERSGKECCGNWTFKMATRNSFGEFWAIGGYIDYAVVLDRDYNL